MKIIIRKAIISDSPAILSLIKELADFERSPEAVLIDQKSLEKDGFNEKPLFGCLVAESSKKVVGMALFHPSYSTWRGPSLYLEDLIVTQKMRGKGIGTKLYNEFLQYALEMGIDRVQWAVLNWNHHAIDFYKKSEAKILTDWRLVQMDRKRIKNHLSKNQQLNENI